MITFFHYLFPFPGFLDWLWTQVRIVNVLFSLRLEGDRSKPELDYNVKQLLANSLTNQHQDGLKCEEHVVLTPDRFKLVLHRIPGNDGPAVMFMHGLMMNSECWLANENLSYPIYLHKLGYDIWMANNRGNKYSWMHENHKRNHPKYWDFSIDELAQYDVPTCIEYIQNFRTARGRKEEKVVYIGFSNGSAQMLAALASQSHLNERISVMIALSPACKIARSHLCLIGNNYLYAFI
eukprot:Filipodium_phascolosomae@DN2596_c0_g1_i18.p1